MKRGSLATWLLNEISRDTYNLDDLRGSVYAGERKSKPRNPRRSSQIIDTAINDLEGTLYVRCGTYEIAHLAKRTVLPPHHSPKRGWRSRAVLPLIAVPPWLVNGQAGAGISCVG